MLTEKEIFKYGPVVEIEATEAVGEDLRTVNEGSSKEGKRYGRGEGEAWFRDKDQASHRCAAASVGARGVAAVSGMMPSEKLVLTFKLSAGQPREVPLARVNLRRCCTNSKELCLGPRSMDSFHIWEEDGFCSSSFLQKL